RWRRSPGRESSNASSGSWPGPPVRRRTIVTNTVLLLLGLGIAVVAWLTMRRLAGALFTMRARSLTPLVLRLLSRRIRTFHYAGDRFFDADGAGEALIARRRQGLERLSGALRGQYAASDAWSERLRESFSDLRFTDANRVPFPFAQFMRENFNLASVVTASDGPRLQDLDGHWTLDVSGSYGVNVAGYGRYKEWMARGLERVRDLGPVLGPLHPVRAENLPPLRAGAKPDEASFHLSGTEAPLARGRGGRGPPPAAGSSYASTAHTTAGGTACSPAWAASGQSTTA